MVGSNTPVVIGDAFIPYRKEMTSQALKFLMRLADGFPREAFLREGLTGFFDWWVFLFAWVGLGFLLLWLRGQSKQSHHLMLWYRDVFCSR